MIIGFIIFSIVTVLFIGIGLWSWNAKEAVGFFTGVNPPKVKDVTAYNHAVAKIWFVFAALLEIVGISILFMEQNSAVVVLPMLLIVALCIGIAVAYVMVEAKYRA